MRLMRNLTISREMNFYNEITNWDEGISEKMNWFKTPLLLPCIGL